MAQTRSDIPRPADPRAAAPRKGDAARDVAAVDADAGAGAEPLDLTEQIEALIGEIEVASAAADPWGEAAQRAAERNAEGEERAIEPSQKLLAKVRDVAAAGVGAASADAIVTDSGAIAVKNSGTNTAGSAEAGAVAAEKAPEVSTTEPHAALPNEIDPAPGADDVLAEALAAELNEATPSTGAPAAGQELAAQAPADDVAIVEEVVATGPAESPAIVPQVSAVAGVAVPGADDAVEAASTLAAELDAALKEAGDALENIVPPEDPPAGAVADSGVEAAAVPAAEPPPAVEPASVAVKDESAKAHWSNAPAPVADVAEVARPDSAISGAPVAATAMDGLDAEDLDAALAAQAEELEEASRVAAAQPPASAPVEAMPAAPAMEAPSAPAAVEAAAPAAAVALAHATHAAAAPVAAVSTAPSSGAKPAPHKTITTPVPIAAPSVEPAKPQPVPAWRKALAGLAKPLRKAGDMLAAPLALLPVNARDIVAYLAAVTIFNASAVWAYMIFIYKPAIPPAAHDTPELHSTEPPPDAHGDKAGGHDSASHGAAAGHGTAEHAPASHGTVPDAASHDAPAQPHGETAANHAPAHADESGHAEAAPGDGGHADASHEPKHEPAPH